MRDDLTADELVEVAISMAAGHNRAADVYRAVNAELGLTKSLSAWRGLLYRRPSDAARLHEALGQPSIRHRRSDGPGQPFDVDEYFRAQLRAAELWSRRKPVTSRAELSIDAAGPVGIVCTSDWHIGNQGTQHQQILTDNRTIAAHPRLLAAVGGDGIDNFVDGMALSHAGHEAVFDYGDQQVAIFQHLLQPLIDSDSIAWVATGNHDGWASRVAGIDGRFNHLRQVPELYVGQGAIITVSLGDQQYRIFRRHRNRWSSVHNPAHAVVMEYQRSTDDWDIGIIEHQHVAHYAPFQGKRRADGSVLRYAVRTGTYKVHDAHAREFGYSGASADLVVLLLWPDRFHIQPVYGLDNAIELLDALG